jgi:hypothetical protein
LAGLTIAGEIFAKNFKASSKHGGLESSCQSGAVKVDQTAELLRDEIANDPDAVSALGRSCNGGAADHSIGAYDPWLRRDKSRPVDSTTAGAIRACLICALG